MSNVCDLSRRTSRDNFLTTSLSTKLKASPQQHNTNYHTHNAQTHYKL